MSRFYRRQLSRVALTLGAMLLAALATAAPAFADSSKWMW